MIKYQQFYNAKRLGDGKKSFVLGLWKFSNAWILLCCRAMDTVLSEASTAICNRWR